MVKRPIIEIDRDKCNGCTKCTTACAEGALVMDDDNKAVLAKDIYCDGLGACLDVCPTGALTVVEKDSAEYDSNATYQHVLKTRGEDAAKHVHQETPAAAQETPPLACGCPGTMAREIERPHPPTPSSKNVDNSNDDGRGGVQSELTQWPIQLHLVSPAAPYFNEVDLLIAADCTAFSLGSFHQDLLKGKKLIIACPKLDDTSSYVDKIAEIIKNNTIYSVTVAIMTVPCCSGMFQIVSEAVEKSGKNIAIKKIVIDIEGRVVDR